MTKTEQDIIYVGIEEPAAVRRGILEASKSLVRILKGQHQLAEIRAQKQKGIEEIRSAITLINELLASVSRMMPHPENLTATAGAGAKKGSARLAKTGPSADSFVNNRVDKFEIQLQDIEEKLKSL